jgi:hypothetical protein
VNVSNKRQYNFLKYKRSDENKNQKQCGVKEKQQRVKGRYFLSQFLAT